MDHRRKQNKTVRSQAAAIAFARQQFAKGQAAGAAPVAPVAGGAAAAGVAARKSERSFANQLIARKVGGSS